MLTKISGKNYKAFEKFDIRISPITILLGANSSGKSSIINLLLMLSQTFDSLKDIDQPLRLNGHKVDLGETSNILHNRNESENIEITLNTSKKKSNTHPNKYLTINYTSHVIFRNIHQTLSKLSHSEIDNLFKKDSALKRLFTKANRIPSGNISKLFHNNNIELLEILENTYKIEHNSNIKSYISHTANLLTIPQENLVATSIKYVFKSELIDEKTNEMKYTIDNVTFYNHEGNNIIKVDFTSKSLHSDLINKTYFNSSTNKIFNSLTNKSLSIFKDNSLNDFMMFDEEFDLPFVSICSIIESSTESLSNQLKDNNIVHVTPLRAQPQRYYLLEKSVNNKSLNTLDGSNLAETLKKNEGIVEKLNDLLADFDLFITLNKTNEIIHQIKIVQNGLELDITDVGFGISQVLPIIVQALITKPDTIIIIEQPEIHLHPKMQTWLMDCLAKIATDQRKNFIIETHSESIVKRLQLRTLDPEYKITYQDINILNFERVSSQEKTITEISEVDVSPLSEIKWPKGFFDEKLNDAIKIQEFRIELLEKEMNTTIVKV